ncbi:MAG: hypothetical protein ABFD60_07835 [Bryobacteraceae bacterium]
MKTFRTKWLGAPNGAANTVPATAGLNVNDISPIFVKASVKINGASVNVAVVGLIKDSQWWAAVSSNLIDSVTVDTTDAQSSTANDFALEVANTANSGCMFGAPLPPSALSIATTTNSAGSPVRVLEYWNSTAWTTIAAAGCLVAQPANWLTTATEDLILFIPPQDWARGGTPVASVNQATYNVRIRCTTAPTTAGLAGRVYVGTVLSGEPALAANGTHNAIWENINGWPCPGAIAAIGGAASTANEGHVLSIVYR